MLSNRDPPFIMSLRTWGPPGYRSSLRVWVYRPHVCLGSTLTPLYTKPLLRWSGRRWGYSSVEVAVMFHTWPQHSYKLSCTGNTPAWRGATAYPDVKLNL